MVSSRLLRLVDQVLFQRAVVPRASFGLLRCSALRGHRPGIGAVNLLFQVVDVLQTDLVLIFECMEHVVVDLVL